MNAFLLFAASYLIGSIPFGVLAAKSKGIDLTKVSSGNVGATNVKRALGWGWALLVFALDISKGLVPALLARQVMVEHSVEWSLGAGLMAVAGHCASPFLKFKGGKGISTGLGALFGSTPYVACGVLAVFLVLMAAYQMVSLGSMGASVSLIPFDLMFESPKPVLACHIGLMLFIFYRHRANIQRIREGKEPKFKLKN